MAESPSMPRAKRQKIDKVGRFAALQKLKDLKQHGQKHKADLSEDVENVYDLVDEKEYVKRTSKYNHDWIEDDGTGYAEDGRDIFDIDSDDSSENDKNQSKGKKRTRNADIRTSLKASHRNLFSKKLANPKAIDENSINLEQDEALANILGQMDDNENCERKIIKPIIYEKKQKESDSVNVKEYMDNFIKTLTKGTVEPEKIVKTEDDIIVENILKSKVKSPTKKIQQEPSCSITKGSKIKIETVTREVSAPIKTEAKNDDANYVESYSEINNDLIPDSDVFDSDFVIAEVPDVKHKETIKAAKISHQHQEENELKALLNNWENICKFDDAEETMTDSKTDENLLQNLDQKSLKLWYWDAWEDVVKRPGEVFLFGKISIEEKAKYKSICVHVGNVERVLYLLPREYHLDEITLEPTKQKVTLTDVYNEFAGNIATKLGIKEFKSEKVTKNFAFHLPGVDVPELCEYIEIRYDGKKPTPDPQAAYKTISHIFGTNTSFLETFLLESKIKGPCWLTLNNFVLVSNPLSWCKVEILCSPSSIKHLEEKPIPPPPPMVVAALNIKSVLNVKTNKNEVSIISCLVNDKFHVDKPSANPPFNRHFCGITLPANLRWPFDFQQKFSKLNSVKASKFDSERALLSWFLAIYQNLDPDLIVMHDVSDCQLDLICDRISALKIPTWSRFGRLKFSQIISKKWKDFFTGRIVCDVKTSAEELIKSRSYDLGTLCQTILKLKENDRKDISNDDIIAMYQTSDGLLKFITLTMQDCSYVLRLMCEMNILPLALQITNICGNLMSRTLQGGRSERNEFLLLHSFYERNYIVPDKKKKSWDNVQPNLEEEDKNVTVDNKNAQGTRKKAAYAGGLVLEPMKGLYDKYVLLMDFNSLYPSIIQEFNICFTTVPEPEVAGEVPSLPDSSVEQGILPRQIRRLVESRREVKKLMATPDLDPDLKMQYNIRQLALKLTANSMYGCLGFAQSRFFAQHLASLVTSKGREILMNTKSLVQKLNFEVVYGDTDSIMVNTNSTDYEQVFKIGNNIKQTINKIYRQIELDIDGVFKYLLLLKKKKYAAVIVNKNSKGELVYQKEFKGLDIVRRDWSQVAIMAGKVVLEEILCDKQLDEKIEAIHSHLEKFKENILNGIFALPLYTITKQLTKAPKEYSSGLTNLPHVTVARRMNDTKNKRYKKGDMVAYVICDDGTQNSAMQRAFHLDELKSNENLKVDTNYYLAQQIHPVVMRLCEPLDGTNSARIAECLGLDPKKFRGGNKTQREHNDEVGVGESVTRTSLQKYRQCEKFKFTCINCKTVNIVASAFKPNEKSYIPVLQKCSNIECNTSPTQYVISIRNQMILTIRGFIKRFYDNWMICDEPTCNANTRKFSHVIINNRPICLICKNGVLIRAYSERDLYNQISYFQYMFDLSKHEHKNVIVPADVEIAFSTIKETIDNLLDKSAYCSVNLNKLFGSLRVSSHNNDTIPDKELNV